MCRGAGTHFASLVDDRQFRRHDTNPPMTHATLPAGPRPGDPDGTLRTGHALGAWVVPDLATLVRIGAVTLQLVLVALVVRDFRLESRALYTLLVLTVAAFPIHALLPRPLRLPAFAVISLLSLVLVLQPGGALLVLVAGALLVGICHLPVAWRYRLILLLGAALGLALLRVGLIANPVPTGVWPVLGAVFMFRLALYAHALRLRRRPPACGRRWGTSRWCRMWRSRCSRWWTTRGSPRPTTTHPTS